MVPGMHLKVRLKRFFSTFQHLLMAVVFGDIELKIDHVATNRCWGVFGDKEDLDDGWIQTRSYEVEEICLVAN